MIGQRIREARDRKGLTLADLATAIGKDKSVMSRIEHGQRNVKSDELGPLAAALEVTADHLMGLTPPRDLLAVAFRIGEQVSPGAQQEAVRAVQNVLEVEQAASRGQGVQLKPRVDLPVPPAGNASPGDAGHNAAVLVREAFGLGDNPISDLAELSEGLGVDVLRTPLPGSVSGLCVRVNGGALIAVDSSPTVGHQRFTLAHEIGHYLLDDQTQGLVIDGSSHFAQEDAVEVRANAFAYELLLPRSALLRILEGSEVTAARFASLLFHFNVSRSALRNRLRGLDLVSYALWEDLGSAEFEPKSLALRYGYFDEWAEGHQARAQTVPPRRVWTLARQAYEEGHIGLGLLATLRGQERDTLAAELQEQGIVPDFGGLEAVLGETTSIT